MSVAVKTRPIRFVFKSKTPKSVIRDIAKKYSNYILEKCDDYVDYFESPQHKYVAGNLTPGRTLKHLREACEFTQVVLGKKMRVGPSRVSDWENGRRAISKSAAKRLSQIFSVSAESFI